MNKRYTISADIGGTHITTAAIDMNNIQVISESRTTIPVDNQGSAKDIIGSWSDAIRFSISKIDAKGLTGISFAMPGPFDYLNGIALIKGVKKFDNLYGVNVQNEIRSSLGLDSSIPIRFINDATAFAIGEAWIGAGKSYSRIIALTLGTGFGTAFIENGLPVLEDPRVPKFGCLYHLPFNNDIADESFSTRWFTKEYKLRTGYTVDGVKEIAEKANLDPRIQQIFTDFGTNLATFLAPWIERFKAQGLVIGGNISRSYPLFEKPLKKNLKNSNLVIDVALSELKEDSALVGSIHLIDHDYYQRIEPLLSKM